MNTNTIVCVAVRMKSKRCPEKALSPLWGKPLILQLTERLKKAILPDKIVWCTSYDPQDDVLFDLAKNNNIEVYRGSRLDVMKRFIRVADFFDADTVVRVTGDNPLTDPVLIDKMIASHRKKRNARYTYTLDAPRGVKPEIISVKTLKELHPRIDGRQSEYMTTQLKQMVFNKNRFISNIGYEHRTLTVDTPEDLKRMQNIYDYYYGEPPSMTAEIIDYLNNYKR